MLRKANDDVSLVELFAKSQRSNCGVQEHDLGKEKYVLKFSYVSQSLLQRCVFSSAIVALRITGAAPQLFCLHFPSLLALAEPRRCSLLRDLQNSDNRTRLAHRSPVITPSLSKRTATCAPGESILSERF